MSFLTGLKKWIKFSAVLLWGFSEAGDEDLEHIARNPVNPYLLRFLAQCLARAS